MRESSIERRLRLLITRAGGLCYKLAPTIRGMPDRLVVYQGQMFMVELKSPAGRLSPIQRVRHRELAERGIDVAVLNSIDDVETWTSELIGESE